LIPLVAETSGGAHLEAGGDAGPLAIGSLEGSDDDGGMGAGFLGADLGLSVVCTLVLRCIISCDRVEV
jgi:hypothetical protein